MDWKGWREVHKVVGLQEMVRPKQWLNPDVAFISHSQGARQGSHSRNV